MLHIRNLLATVLISTLALFSIGTSAAGDTAQAAQSEATLVVYRAGETARTKRLRIDVRLDGQKLGRVSREDVLASEKPAGAYVVSTGISGAETLAVDLKPGHVHYVRIDVRERSSRLKVALVEVEEQVAHLERPELASAI